MMEKNTSKEPKFKIFSNPDKSTLELVAEAIKSNDGYCCCAIDKIDDNKCICKNFKETDEAGFCHCGRYYKIKDYPTIAIICQPDDSDRAQVLAEEFTTQGFIILTPFYRNTQHYINHLEEYRDIQKTKIEKADLIFVMNSNEEATEFLEEEIYWAMELNKKIIYEHTELEENKNEN